MLKLRFCVSPVAILGEGKVEAIEVVRNALVVGGDGEIRAEPTGEREVIPCGIVFRSVGYRGVPLADLPFDERRGTIPNEGGRVVDGNGAPVAGVYCTGWIKRGPSGVIGTNKKDATETVELLLGDVRNGRLPPRGARGDLGELVGGRGHHAVTYEGWGAIDAVESALGEPLGKPRVKLRSWHELLAASADEPAR